MSLRVIYVPLIRTSKIASILSILSNHEVKRNSVPISIIEAGTSVEARMNSDKINEPLLGRTVSFRLALVGRDEISTVVVAVNEISFKFNL